METAKPIQFAKSCFWTVVDAILPPRCLVTGDIVDRQGTVSPAAWRDLRFIAAPLCACCGIPFEFEVSGESRCAKCLSDPPPYQSARAALVYDEASRGMILKFKHGDQTHAALAFVPWLQRAGADMLAQADVIVPVPLHRFRLIQRRYNQAALIGQALSRASGIPDLPLALQRVKATRSQGHMGYKARKKNVKGAFRMAPRFAEEIKGKTVILIDDVYTTGATAGECAKALLAGGASAVHILAVARVVKPEFRD
ncbi:MAG: ComF family protein [Rhodospirillales bacterium]|nr:ComF family protein [Rhodospirillales bacterium]